MSMSRFLTTLIQIGLVSICFLLVKELIRDIKENGFFK
jgi:hypothetical protein